MIKKIGVIIAIIAVLFLVQHYISVDQLLSFIESFKANPFAPIIFIGIYFFAVIFAVPASALTLISAPLFGFVPGLIYTIIASNLGCYIPYFLGKILGEDVIEKYVKKGSFVNEAQVKAKENGFVFMMYVRLIPLFPFSAVNYFSGALGIKYRDYALASFLGMLPGSVIYVFLGYSATSVNDNPLALVVSVIILVLFTLVVSYYRKRSSSIKEKNSYL